MFSPGIWWIGFEMYRSGSEVQILQMHAADCFKGVGSASLENVARLFRSKLVEALRLAVPYIRLRPVVDHGSVALQGDFNHPNSQQGEQCIILASCTRARLTAHQQ
ncbi:MAG: hypothetical protein ABJT31_00270 [Hyphomicrobiales bacterium]